MQGERKRKQKEARKTVSKEKPIMKEKEKDWEK